MLNWLRLLFLFLILLNASITYAQKNQTDQNKVEHANNIYTEEKLNILVTANQPEFTIQLKSNPTTGYSWFLREYSNEIIQPVSHQYLSENKNLIGAGGVEVWTFKVKSSAFVVPQQTTLRFIYARPWEGTENGSQIVFHISIKP